MQSRLSTASGAETSNRVNLISGTKKGTTLPGKNAKERINAYQEKWRSENPEANAAYVKKWQSENPEVYAVSLKYSKVKKVRSQP